MTSHQLEYWEFISYELFTQIKWIINCCLQQCLLIILKVGCKCNIIMPHMNFQYKTPKGPNVTLFTIARRRWQNSFDYNGGSETQISSRKNAYNSVVREWNFILFHSWTPWVVFSLVATPLVKILLLIFIRCNKIRSYTEKITQLCSISFFLLNPAI